MLQPLAKFPDTSYKLATPSPGSVVVEHREFSSPSLFAALVCSDLANRSARIPPPQKNPQ
jgi:hypothetical protein